MSSALRRCHRRRRGRGICTTVLVIAFVISAVPACSLGSQTVAISASFYPSDARTDTTLMFGFQIGTTNGQIPSPVTDVNLRLPAGVGLGLGNLGLATCGPAALERRGPSGCSPNSLMGSGQALVKVPFGPVPVSEPVALSIFLGSPKDGHTTLLFFAEGLSPVFATLVFPGTLLPSFGQFGASLNTIIPLTPSAPGAADASVVRMQSALGPRYLTYYKRVRGRFVGYRPEGLQVPESCPHGGFPFAASFTFQDGTTATATTTVPCHHGNHAGGPGRLRSA
jgi:hypothetical protein